jgi:hypothetical protein
MKEKGAALERQMVQIAEVRDVAAVWELCSEACFYAIVLRERPS